MLRNIFKIKYPGLLFFMAVTVMSFPAYSQVTPTRLQQFLYSSESKHFTERAELIQRFYKSLNYQHAWLGSNANINRQDLLDMLQQASGYGLEEMHYQYDFIKAYRNGVSPATVEDSIEADLKFTDAAVHFFTDIAFGTKPALGYHGLNYEPICRDISLLVSEYYSKNQLRLFANMLDSGMPQIKLILERIRLLERKKSDSSFSEEKIRSAAVNHNNKPLLKKLYYLGLSDSVDQKNNRGIKDRLTEAQRQFNLLSDGVLRGTIIAELNVPVAIRIKQLKTAINYYRWLYCLTQQEPVIVVNIPAAYLKVYDADSIMLQMKMVVGARSTPTPSLSSRVTEVVLYPYWTVPYSIATKELLPAIKKDPGYINAHNFQVLNKQGKVMDPYKINWQELSASNFPYTIRQSTGCDNALGTLKLNFYNPYSVYLHDTPYKSLFLLNKRYFSHGCMRLEKPVELGYLILKNNRIAIDTITEKGCLLRQSPLVVPADEKMPVVVWYNPVDTDATGRVIFYEDIYRKFVK
jgi:L,D-transpeptidase YcbB